MDALSLFGITLALIAIIGGNYLEGGHIGALVNGPAALIVLGGTLGATMLQTPWPIMRRALSQLRYVFWSPRVDFIVGISQVVSWAITARKDGLLGLESIAEDDSTDPFTRKGLELLVDGSEPEVIRNIMEVDSLLREDRDLEAARFFESMGGYAPTIGILGAVIGLIHVMGNLADPERLGPGIAVAFVATIYGVGFANLLLLPIASKLRVLANRAREYRELMIEGVVSIADGENPRAIELKLNGYLHS